MTTPSYRVSTAAAYDAMADRYAELIRGILDHAVLDRAVLAAFAEFAAGGPVLEAGCGPGHMTAHLRDLGLDAAGVDLSPELIAIARRDHPGLRFDVGAMEHLDRPDGALTGILAWYSVIHVPPAEWPGCLAEFARVLRPGGCLLLGFFEAEGDAVVEMDHRVAPAFRWPLADVAALGRDTGFDEIARVLREPTEGERFRQGRVLLRRR